MNIYEKVAKFNSEISYTKNKKKLSSLVRTVQISSATN